MIKHIWSVLCQRSVIDQESNNASLIDVFEQLQVDTNHAGTSEISAPKDISVPVRYELVNFWSKTKEGEEERGSVRILLSDPAGREIQRIENEIVIPQSNKRIREINKIQGITLKGSGVYNFIISIRQQSSETYEPVAELPLEVKISRGN